MILGLTLPLTDSQLRLSIVSQPSDQMDHFLMTGPATETPEAMQEPEVKVEESATQMLTGDLAIQTPVQMPAGDLAIQAPAQMPAGDMNMPPRGYSTNPNTVRVRRRNANLSPYRRAVERARSNDQKAVAAAWKDRVTTETYKSASERRKAQILDEVQKEVMDRRRRKKIDAESKISDLNVQYGGNGGGGSGGDSNENTADEGFVGESVLAARAATASSEPTTRPVPRMAPPGYAPYPKVQPISELMNPAKKQSTLTAAGLRSPSVAGGATNAFAGDAADAFVNSMQGAGAGAGPSGAGSSSGFLTLNNTMANNNNNNNNHGGGQGGEQALTAAEKTALEQQQNFDMIVLRAKLEKMQYLIAEQMNELTQVAQNIENPALQQTMMKLLESYHEDIAKLNVECQNGTYVVDDDDEKMWKQAIDEDDELDMADIPSA